MRMKKRITAALGLAASLAAVTVFPAFAEWKYDENVGKWWWQEYDGTYPRSEAGDAGTPFAVSRYLDGNGAAVNLPPSCHTAAGTVLGAILGAGIKFCLQMRENCGRLIHG